MTQEVSNTVLKSAELLKELQDTAESRVTSIITRNVGDTNIRVAEVNYEYLAAAGAHVSRVVFSINGKVYTVKTENLDASKTDFKVLETVADAIRSYVMESLLNAYSSGFIK